jgi:3-deoxy-D-manno-octulosonate 8-phosphate phosphatase KdsC-like HAD superfamily phosphatase
MLHPETAMHAVRLLGVDIANTMTQLAVYQATAEELIEALNVIDERAWQPLLSDDEEPTVIGIKLPVDQQLAVQRILMLIGNLR